MASAAPAGMPFDARELGESDDFVEYWLHLTLEPEELPPGGDLRGSFAWKTEIVRSVPNRREVVLDGSHRPCDPWFRSRATCTFCTLRTPLASRACRGWTQ